MDKKIIAADISAFICCPIMQNKIWIWLLVGSLLPSVLWCCWLGGRKGIWPVKNWVVGCWRGYLSGARCILDMFQLMPLPRTVSCSSKIQIGFTFLVPAHPGSPGQKAIKRVYVCVCAFVSSSECQTVCTVIDVDNELVSASATVTDCYEVHQNVNIYLFNNSIIQQQ